MWQRIDALSKGQHLSGSQQVYRMPKDDHFVVNLIQKL